MVLTMHESLQNYYHKGFTLYSNTKNVAFGRHLFKILRLAYEVMKRLN